MEIIFKAVAVIKATEGYRFISISRPFNSGHGSSNDFRRKSNIIPRSVSIKYYATLQ